MLFNTIISSLLLLTVAEAAALPAPSDVGLQKKAHGVYKLGFSRRQVESDDLVARGTAEMNYVNQDSYYVTDLYFGSNMQKISVVVDTGSSDLWVVDKKSDTKSLHGTYDPKGATKTSKSFSVKYFDNSNAKGDFVKDEVSLSPDGPTIPNFEFANANEANGAKYGILGLGLKELEQTTSKYDNFPLALKNGRVIKKAAYSVFSTDDSKNSGTVLFGGIDNAKYSGSLAKMSITDKARLSINVKSMTFNDKKVDVKQSVTLDTGSSQSHLQPEILEGIAKAAGLTKGSGFYYYKKCTDAKDFTIAFDGIDIKVPIKYMTSPLSDANGNKLKSCALTVLPSTKPNSLGANFMRSVYTVIDVQDKTISLAPIKFTDKEDIKEIS